MDLKKHFPQLMRLGCETLLWIIDLRAASRPWIKCRAREAEIFHPISISSSCIANKNGTLRAHRQKPCVFVSRGLFIFTHPRIRHSKENASHEYFKPRAGNSQWGIMATRPKRRAVKKKGKVNRCVLRGCSPTARCIFPPFIGARVIEKERLPRPRTSFKVARTHR